MRTRLRDQGTIVTAVHVGYMDTEMASHVQTPKADPADVARQVLAALEAGREEVLADDITRRVKQGLSAEPAVYIQFR